MTQTTDIGIWQLLLFGVAVVLVILLFRPGLKAAIKASSEAENQDWKTLILPLGAVIVFVLLLIALV